MKKKYVPLPKVREFVADMPEDVQEEYRLIVAMLEREGWLVEPYGKKVDKDLFEIRVRGSQNMRILYFYYVDNLVLGVHGFVKKTQKMPKHEKKQAEKIIRKIKGGQDDF